MKYVLTHFLRRDQVHFDLKFFNENKTITLLHPISVYAFHALLSFHHSWYVGKI